MLAEANVAESGPSAKRNWWAATRELVRVTKGKGLIISGGAEAEADLRPPRDVANLYASNFFLVLSLTIHFVSIAILGLSQDSAHEASTKVPKSLIARARKPFYYYLLANTYNIFFIGPSTIETRKTYRAVLSEPKLVVPYGELATHDATPGETEKTPQPLPTSSSTSHLKLVNLASHFTIIIDKNNKKRKRESSLK